jgi:hypothetical protein
MIGVSIGAALLASVSHSRAAEPPGSKSEPAGTAASGSAQPAGGDVVKLKNGGLLRGSIAELVPGHFVVIVLITGETRRIPAEEFEYAGPDRAAESPPSEEEEEEEEEEEAEEPEPRRRSGRIVRNMDRRPLEDLVSVRSTGEAVRVYVRAPAKGEGKRFSEVCKTPCEVELEPGSYEMALSEIESSEPVEARERVRIESGANLEATYESREGVRLAGIFLMLGGGATGAVVAATADQKCVGGECQADSTQVAIGVLIAAGCLAGGIVMMTRSDVVQIELVPSSAGALPARGALAGIADSSGSWGTLPGLGIAARF